MRDGQNKDGWARKIKVKTKLHMPLALRCTHMERANKIIKKIIII